jgi:hypothetical protein
MLHLKDTIDKETEEEIAEFKRKAENEVWKKIAGRMANIGGGNYSAEAIEKGYIKEKKDGFPHKATVDAVMNSVPVDAGQKEPSTGAADTFNAAEADANDAEEDANADVEMDEA